MNATPVRTTTSSSLHGLSPSLAARRVQHCALPGRESETARACKERVPACGSFLSALRLRIPPPKAPLSAARAGGLLAGTARSGLRLESLGVWPGFASACGPFGSRERFSRQDDNPSRRATFLYSKRGSRCRIRIRFLGRPSQDDLSQ